MPCSMTLSDAFTIIVENLKREDRISNSLKRRNGYEK